MNFLTAAKTADWIIVGLTKFLAIMAVLQLVKKIPDIINSIFGTNIKTRGGIKGRLGEMAGIGGLAQKAWTALGNTGKNLAKLGLTAPAAAGFAIGNQLYKKKHGIGLADTKAGRVLRGGASGVGSALKTGSWVKARDAALASYDKLSTSPTDKARRLKLVNDTVKKDLTVTDAQGTSKNVINEMVIPDKLAARSKLDQRVKAGFGKEIYNANVKQQKAAQALNLAKSIASDNEAVGTLMNTAISRQTVGSAGHQALIDALSAYESEGGLRGIENLKNFAMNNAGLFDEATWKNLLGPNGKLTAKERKLVYADADFRKGDNSDLGLTANNLTNLNAGKSSVEFLANNTLKSSYDDAKSDYDVAVAGQKMTDIEKMELDKYVGAMTDINNSMAFAVGRNYGDNHYGTLFDANGNEIDAADPNWQTVIDQNGNVVQEADPQWHYVSGESVNQAANARQEREAEAQRQADEARAQAEADRQAEERRQQEAQRQAEERRQREQERQAEEQRQALIAQLKAQKEALEDQYKRLGNSAYPGSNEERENIRRQINEIDSRLAELG